MALSIVMLSGCQDGRLAVQFESAEGRPEGIVATGPGEPVDYGEPGSPEEVEPGVPRSFFELADHTPTVGLRGMTRAELSRSLAIKTGVSLDLSALPPEPKLRHMRNDASQLRVRDGLHQRQLLDMASRVAADADIDVVIPCDQQRCSDDELRDALEMITVSALEGEALQPYLDLYTRSLGEDGDHDFAKRVVLQQILLSPRFLYRTELGSGQGPLRDTELAKKLSFFLWGSMPDETLSRLALSGQLRQSGVYAAEVERLMASERMHVRLIELFENWLDVGDPRLERRSASQELEAGTDEAMRREFELAITRGVLEHDRSLVELLRAPTSWIDGRLAQLYGIEGIEGDEMVEAELPVDQGRLGLLTTAYVLLSHNKDEGRSPMRYGDFLVSALTCTGYPAEAGVAIMDLPADEDDTSLRERFEPLRQAMPCGNCHRVLNAGFALDIYDNVGRRWPRELVPDDEASGVFDLPPHEPLSFSSTREAIEGLATHPALSHCFVAQTFRLAQGHMPSRHERAVVGALHEEFLGQGHKIPGLLRAIARHPEFATTRSNDDDHQEDAP